MCVPIWIKRLQWSLMTNTSFSGVLDVEESKNVTNAGTEYYVL